MEAIDVLVFKHTGHGGEKSSHVRVTSELTAHGVAWFYYHTLVLWTPYMRVGFYYHSLVL
jgi:hypothetical protein